MPITEEQRKRIAEIAERINSTSNADFVKRLLDSKRKVIHNPDGTVSTHELGYVTEGDHAVVFPGIQSTRTGLVRFPYPESYERAVEQGDTVHMSVPDAELFTKNYKEFYPEFKYKKGGKIHIKPENISKLVNKKFADGGDTEDDELFDVVDPSSLAARRLRWLPRRAVKKFANEDFLNQDYATLTVGDSGREGRALTRKQRLYNRTFRKAADEYAKQEADKALERMAIDELQTGEPTGAFKELTRQGVESGTPIAAAIMTGAVAPWLAQSVPVLGSAAAKGLELMGEYAMPSTFLKGVSTVFPALSKATAAVSPWLDAGALSLWSAQGMKHAGERWKEGDKATAAAEASLASLPFAMPVSIAAQKQAQKISDWSDFVLNGRMGRYYNAIGRRDDKLNRALSELRAADYQSSLPDVAVDIPYETKIFGLSGERSLAAPERTFLDFVSPEGTSKIEQTVVDVGRNTGVRGEVQADLPRKSGELGKVTLVSKYDTHNPIAYNYTSAGNNKNPDRTIRLDDQHYFPYYGDINVSSPEKVSIRPDEYSTMDSYVRGQIFSGSSGIQVQAPMSPDNAVSRHYAEIQTTIGQDGVVAGSGNLYSAGILSGKPADMEIITTENKLPELTAKLNFKQTGSNEFDVRGISPKAHSKGETDIQVIEEGPLGDAQGKLAWEMFRTMHPEECHAQAQASIDVGTTYTNMGIINPATGSTYSADELLNEFIEGNWTLQNTVNDALSIMKDLRQQSKLKHNRPIALLTNESEDVQNIVSKSIDTIGKSQLGSAYTSGSSYFPNIDFGDVEGNKAFLEYLGLNDKFADNPRIMQNLFDYWYLQQSTQKRVVRDAKDLQQALDWATKGAHDYGGGAMSGAGRNTVASTFERTAFSHPQVGVSQTHLTRHPEKFDSIQKVVEQSKSFDENAKISPEKLKSAKDNWDLSQRVQEEIFGAMPKEQAESIDRAVYSLFNDSKPQTISDLSDGLVYLSRQLKKEGVSDSDIDIVIDNISDIFDLPFIKTSSYMGNYRGVLNKDSAAAGVRYFDFSSNRSYIQPYEFGRPVEKYNDIVKQGTYTPIPGQEAMSELPEDVRIPFSDFLKKFNNMESTTIEDLAKQGYDINYADLRPEKRDAYKRVLDLRNEAKDLDREVEYYESMPGAKRRLSKFNFDKDFSELRNSYPGAERKILKGRDLKKLFDYASRRSWPEEIPDYDSVDYAILDQQGKIRFKMKDGSDYYYIEPIRYDDGHIEQGFYFKLYDPEPDVDLPYALGGKIHIKPENRGKFTELKKRTGHSATWFKQHGTPAQKKMATFALNAKHWNHADGGPMSRGFLTPDALPTLLQQFTPNRQTVDYPQVEPLNLPEQYVPEPAVIRTPIVDLSKYETAPEVVVPYTPEASAEIIANQEYDSMLNNILNRQRYAESGFNDRAVNKSSGATGAYQIMPVAYKDYLHRGHGKEGDLMNASYNRLVRDHVVKMVPRDLGSEFYSPADTAINRHAKEMAVFNAGAVPVKRALRKAKAAGVDIVNTTDWIKYLPSKETRDYVNFVVLNQDIAGTGKNAEAYNRAYSRFKNRRDLGGMVERMKSLYNNDKQAMLNAISRSNLNKRIK